MSSGVARPANRDAVGDVVAQCGVFCPRLEMVSVQARRVALAAVTTCPAIAVKDGTTPTLVLGLAPLGTACGSRAALPIGMRRPDQMRVARRGASHSLDSGTDGRAMGVGQRTAAQRCGDLVALLLRGYPPCCRRLSRSRCADLRSRILALSGIGMQVRPGRSAGAGAEPLTAPTIGLPALFADTSRHKPHLTGESCC